MVIYSFLKYLLEDNHRSSFHPFIHLPGSQVLGWLLGMRLHRLSSQNVPSVLGENRPTLVPPASWTTQARDPPRSDVQANVKSKPTGAKSKGEKRAVRERRAQAQGEGQALAGLPTRSGELSSLQSCRGTLIQLPDELVGHIQSQWVTLSRGGPPALCAGSVAHLGSGWSLTPELSPCPGLPWGSGQGGQGRSDWVAQPTERPSGQTRASFA